MAATPLTATPTEPMHELADIEVPGKPEFAGRIRRCVTKILGRRLPRDHPAVWATIQGLDELVSNAVRHSASGEGGLIRVQVGLVRITLPKSGDSAFRVLVTDCGGDSAPAVRPADDMSESGRGLGIVAAISRAWGVVPTENGMTVWFEVPLALALALDHVST
jgi:anti-sigma regulatory factor (Ser/Thr protein kinase)